MGHRRIAKMTAAAVLLGSVVVPGAAMLGTAESAAASDTPAKEALVDHGGDADGVAGLTRIGSLLAFGLLCAGALLAGGRRVWTYDELDADEVV
jgi:hypothetical protein